MKTTTEMIDRASQTGQMMPPETTWHHSEETMVGVWRGLLAMKLVTEQVGSTDYRYWRAGLRSVTDDQLKRGLKNAAKFSGYLVLGKFRDLCLLFDPTEYGLPDTRAAYTIACRLAYSPTKSDWPNAAVYHAAADCQFWELARASHGSQLERDFARAYEIRVGQYAAGSLPPIPAVELIGQPGPRKASAAVREKHLRALRALIA